MQLKVSIDALNQKLDSNNKEKHNNENNFKFNFNPYLKNQENKNVAIIDIDKKDKKDDIPLNMNTSLFFGENFCDDVGPSLLIGNANLKVKKNSSLFFGNPI